MSSITANSKTRKYARDVDDFYVEPAWCVEALIDALPWSLRVDCIYDPCCGSGTIPDTFSSRAFRAWGSDLHDRRASLFDQCDFLSHDALPLPPEGNVSFVMNPPYRLAEAFVRKAISLTDHRVCTLLPLSFLASQGRYKLFSDHPPSDILILSKRPSMPPGREIADMGKRAFKGGTVDYFWLVHTRGWDRETRTKWIMPKVPVDRSDDDGEGE